MDTNDKKQIVVEKHKWPDELAIEKTKRRNRIIVVVLLVSCFGLGFLVNNLMVPNTSVNNKPVISEKNTSNYTNSDKFNEIYELMSNEWYFGKDVDDLETYIMDNAINGLSNSDLDQHTTYMGSEEAASLMSSLSGSLIGIGIQYYQIGEDLLVEKVYMDSPAEKGGMKEGDILKKVDGTSITGMETDKVKELIMGEEGTRVKVEVLRGSETKTLTMTRAEVSITAYGYVKDGVGILELSSFSQNTAQEVENYLASFEEENVKGIVIDLRDNGGGYVNTAIDIASLLVDEDEVVLYQEDKEGDLSEYTTKGGKKFEFDEVVMLVNGNTASASELLTAALQEHIGAKVVGVNTYGKGTVQKSVEFEDGSLFKYTIAEWLTPTKEKINKVGIKPEFEVKLDPAITYTVENDDDKTYEVDSVGQNVATAQVYLKFLGYDIDRTDGYFSQKTLAALKAYQKAEGLSEDGKISKDLVSKIVSSTSRKWHDNKDKLDAQMIKAMEVANGK